MSSLPLVAPLFPAGKEPLPPGVTEEDRAQLLQAKKYQAWMSSGVESCAAKTAIAGIGGKCTHLSRTHYDRVHQCRLIVLLFSVGLGIGAFFSLMSTSFAYEDPYLRAQSQTGMSNTQKAREIFKDMGKGMWRSGKGFGKVGALFAGIECVIEGARGSRHRLQWVLTLLF
jgi:import inner membrane translocase subunit TIM22